MPPSQLVIARQKNTLRPYSEKSRKIVAPVVVSPDIDSNVASIDAEAVPQVGNAGEHRDEQPRHRDHRQPLDASHALDRLLGRLAAGVPHQVADRRPSAPATSAKPCASLKVAVEQRERERRQEHQPEHADHDADDVDD